MFIVRILFSRSRWISNKVQYVWKRKFGLKRTCTYVSSNWWFLCFKDGKLSYIYNDFSLDWTTAEFSRGISATSRWDGCTTTYARESRRFLFFVLRAAMLVCYRKGLVLNIAWNQNKLLHYTGFPTNMADRETYCIY